VTRHFSWFLDPAAGRTGAPFAVRCAVAAAAAALATAAASAPVGLHWLQWVALAPLLRALDGLTPRRAFLVGWAAGVGANAALFSWLAPAVRDYGDLPAALAWLAFAVYAPLTGLQYGAVGLLDAMGRAAWPRARRVLFVGAFVAVELVWPQLFHWSLGSPQALNPVVVQLADLGGPVVLSLVVVAANGAVDALLDALRAGARAARVEAALLAAVVAAACGYGAWRLDDFRTRLAAAPTVRVAVVQPLAIATGPQPSAPAAVEAALAARLREVGDVDLVVLPESAAPEPAYAVEPGGDALLERELLALARRTRAARVRLARLAGAPLLLGATWRRVRARPDGEPEVLERRNALLLLGPDGASLGRYDKHALLAFGERLPGESLAPWLRDVLPSAGDFTAGPGPRPLAAPRAGGAELRVGPLICYEAVPSVLTADLCRADPPPDLLVNATNDVWFTAQGAHLHHMIVVPRAVESRRTLVRATTTGVSSVVRPDGVEVARLGRGEAGVLVVDAPLLRGATTPFLRWGRAPMWLLAAAWAIALALGIPRGRRAGAGAPPGRPAPDGG